MGLAVGSRLGHYDVTALIGEGGMGQVYQATDTKLKRQVALKILPEAFASDPDRLARFQREAQVLASLNHPNIAAIYGIEEAEGTRALVLELVEGPTLADRIARGPISVDEAVPIAKQIAEALEAAHEAGVIHRDLKPANIKVRDDGTVKVLDFGLAKALDTTPDGDPSQSPTLTAAATQMGLIMGTAAYMSPKQASGEPTDRRSDIWSFGVVVLEMLTGRRQFEGKTVSHVLASVLKSDPDWTSLPTTTPPPLVRLLHRCFEKEPKRRLRDIGEAVIQLEEAVAQSAVEPSAPAVVATSAPSWRKTAPLAVGALVVGGIVTGLAVWSVTRSVSLASVTRFAVTLQTGTPPPQSLAFSHDGETVVYAEQGRLYRRALDQFDGQYIPGTEGAASAFFSPEDDWVGFFAFPDLKKVALAEGPPMTLVESAGGTIGAFGGATWGSDDTIVFSRFTNGLWQVPALGGQAQQLTTPDSDQGESFHALPEFLPGAESLLFQATGADGEHQIVLLSPKTGERRTLLPGSRPRYVATGHLLFARGESLWRVPFDGESLEVSGEPFPVLEGLQTNNNGSSAYAVSAHGSLVYAPGGGVSTPQRTLVWIDREGNEEVLSAPPRAYIYPRISPDGTRVAIEHFVSTSDADIWVWDFARETLTRLTVDPAADEYPVWTPDGERVIFTSRRDGAIPNPYWVAADGTGTAERLAENPNFLYPHTISPDGTRLVMREGVDPANLVVMTLDGERRIEPLISAEAFSERNAEISADGRWIAYESNESGQFEIYVRPFPDVDSGRSQISARGGRGAVWARSGEELFYRNLDGVLMGVPVEL